MQATGRGDLQKAVAEYLSNADMNSEKQEQVMMDSLLQDSLLTA